MLTKQMWKMYWDGNLEFSFECLMAGLALMLFTPVALIFDLIFMIPEIIIYKKNEEED